MWPPNSPDLSLVYYKIWSVVLQRVYQLGVHNMDKQKQCLLNEWHCMDHCVIDDATIHILVHVCGQIWTLKQNTCAILWQSLAGAAPAYLADDCCLLSDVGRRPLRSNSNDTWKLLVPRTHNKLGDRSFSAAGPRLWNDLPPGLWRPGLAFDSFRKSL